MFFLFHKCKIFQEETPEQDEVALDLVEKSDKEIG